MKLDFQAKFLQHLNKKRKTDEGFTLIELLVVIIIIGILAAIALPSLLGQVNKAKQSEAKNNIGAMNRAQQAAFLEYGTFSTDLSVLGIAISTTSSNYSYVVLTDAVSNVANNIANALIPKAKTLKSYVGIVGTVQGSNSTSELLTQAAACESVQVGQGGHVASSGVAPVLTPECPNTHRNLSR